MISIQRTQCPNVLKSAPARSSRYRNKKVVLSLWNMQHEKCCYCEQKIPPKGHDKAVDHFRPQAIFKYLINQWENLLLACAQCNGRKSDRFPVKLTSEDGEAKVLFVDFASNEMPLIINPADSSINPEEFITFIVATDDHEEYGLIVEKDGNALGRITIDTIGLDDIYYTKKRRDYLFNILMQTYYTMLTAHDNGDQDSFEIQRDKLQMFVRSQFKFSALARAFARKKKLNCNPFNLEIP